VVSFGSKVLVQALAETEPVGQEADDSCNHFQVHFALVFGIHLLSRTPGLPHSSIVAIDDSQVLQTAGHGRKDISQEKVPELHFSERSQEDILKCVSYFSSTTGLFGLEGVEGCD